MAHIIINHPELYSPTTDEIDNIFAFAAESNVPLKIHFCTLSNPSLFVEYENVTVVPTCIEKYYSTKVNYSSAVPILSVDPVKVSKIKLDEGNDFDDDSPPADSTAESATSSIPSLEVSDEIPSDTQVTFDETKDAVIVIDYTAARRKKAYDPYAHTYLGVMYRLNAGTFENRWYLTPTGKEDLLGIFKSYVANTLDKHSNPFNGTVASAKDQKLLYSLIKEYSSELIIFLEAGFHKERIEIPKGKVIPGWMMNLHSYGNALLINYFGLYPTAPDKVEHRTMEFGENPQYRKIVTQAMEHVVSSFVLANTPGSKPGHFSDSHKLKSYKIIAH